MKTKTLKTMLVATTLFATLFAAHAQTDPLARSRQVARNVNGLIAADRASFSNDVVTFPLSFFTEEMQILKLDDNDAATVAHGAGVEISDNYILVKGRQQIPYKLFEKKTGKFVVNIGSFGQGPGEYQNVYDHQLDEANNRIYLLPWQARYILAYDLMGKALPPIRLPYFVPKGKFYVDTKAETVTVVTLPFPDAPAVVWTQTFSGEVIQSIAPGHLGLPRDFSNEVAAWKDDKNFDLYVFSFVPQADTLYRYDRDANKLVPRFTMNFGRQDLPIHFYNQSANYFFGDLSEPKQLDDYTTTTQNHRFYIVDKQTLKGSFFRVENDFLGNIEIGYPMWIFGDNYYTRNLDPGELRDELEKTLSTNNRLSPEMRTKLTNLKNYISDNDNNYILYARVKK